MTPVWKRCHLRIPAVPVPQGLVWDPTVDDTDDFHHHFIFSGHRHLFKKWHFFPNCLPNYLKPPDLVFRPGNGAASSLRSKITSCPSCRLVDHRPNGENVDFLPGETQLEVMAGINQLHILKNVGLPVENGGSTYDLDTIQKWLGCEAGSGGISHP